MGTEHSTAPSTPPVPVPRLQPLERSPRPIHPGVNIGHVHLRTADLGRVHHFYVEILGFDVTARMRDALFVSAGGYHHTLGFNTWGSKGGSPPPPGSTGLYHVAIRYPSRVTLADALRRLVNVKWPLDGTADHGTHEAIYLRDPDGTLLGSPAERVAARRHRPSAVRRRTTGSGRVAEARSR